MRKFYAVKLFTRSLFVTSHACERLKLRTFHIPMFGVADIIIRIQQDWLLNHYVQL